MMPDTSMEYHTVCMVIASTYIELAASFAYIGSCLLVMIKVVHVLLQMYMYSIYF